MRIFLTPNEGNLLLAVVSTMVASDLAVNKREFEEVVATLSLLKNELAVNSYLTIDEHTLPIVDAWLDCAEELVRDGIDEVEERRRALSVVRSINAKLVKVANA